MKKEKDIIYVKIENGLKAKVVKKIAIGGQYRNLTHYIENMLKDFVKKETK